MKVTIKMKKPIKKPAAGGFAKAIDKAAKKTAKNIRRQLLEAPTKRTRAIQLTTSGPEIEAPELYRSDLLREANRKRGAGFRHMSKITGLSHNTIGKAFDGYSTKLDVLWKLANYFEIPWPQLFNVKAKTK